MDFHDLQDFFTLSKVLNFARAADELFTTQATLSRHIAGMEKELGRPLFNRTTRRVELTEFGQEFLPYASKILNDYAEMINWLSASEKQEYNRLFIALATPISIIDMLQQIFIDFSLKNPEFNLETIQSDNDDYLLSGLSKGDYDLAVVREPLNTDDNFQRCPVFPVEPLCIVLNCEHSMAGQKKVTLRELQDEIFYLPPPTSYSYQLFLNQCHLEGFEPKIRPSLRGRDFAFGIAQSRKGVPVMSKLPAMSLVESPEYKDRSDGVAVLEIDPPILQQVNFIYPEITSKSSATAHFIQYYENLHSLHSIKWY